MLDRQRILTLIPHQGAMCLLDRVVDWSADDIVCEATSHRSSDNPLREAGGLGAIAGIEYGLQAAALHGALTSGGPRPPGYLAALRDVDLRVDRIDPFASHPLRVEARRELRAPSGLIYRFAVSANGVTLVEGRATVVEPKRPE